MEVCHCKDDQRQSSGLKIYYRTVTLPWTNRNPHNCSSDGGDGGGDGGSSSSTPNVDAGNPWHTIHVVQNWAVHVVSLRYTHSTQERLLILE